MPKLEEGRWREGDGAQAPGSPVWAAGLEWQTAESPRLETGAIVCLLVQPDAPSQAEHWDACWGLVRILG